MPLFVWWGRHPDCRANFDDLFVAKNTHVLNSPNQYRFLRVRLFEGKGRSRPTSAMLHSGHYKRFTTKPGLHGAAVSARLASLRLRDDLAIHVEAFCNEVPVHTMIGLHIRRTDFAICRRGWSGPKNDARVCAHIDETLEQTPDARFLLCADNQHTVTWLQERYGPERIVWRNITMLTKRKRHSTPQEAAIDLFILARTKRIVGTTHSSFSSFAAHLSNLDLIRV